MRRKTIGLLLLALVVVAGVLFVEQNTGGRAAGREAADSPVLRLIVGGGPARVPEPAPPAPGAEAAAPSGGTPTAASAGPAAAPEPPARELRYQVRAGDTLGAITRDHLGSAAKDLVERVARRNSLSDPDNLKPGCQIIIPVERYEEHLTSGRESLRDLSQRFYGAPNRVAALRRVNPDLPDRDDSALEAGRVVWIPR